DQTIKKREPAHADVIGPSENCGMGETIALGRIEPDGWKNPMVLRRDIMHQSLTISRRAFLAGTASVGAAAIVMHPFAALAQANQAHLRILETTDIHVNLLPYDYYADAEDNTLGLARTAAIIEQIRAEAGNAILLDNGDMLQGSPLGDYVAYERGVDETDIHPTIAAMNVLGYDAGTIGNHEFNYGLPFLEAAIAGAQFPVVLANVVRGDTLADNPADDGTMFPPYVIVEKELTDGAGETHT